MPENKPYRVYTVNGRDTYFIRDGLRVVCMDGGWSGQEGTTSEDKPCINVGEKYPIEYDSYENLTEEEYNVRQH